MVVGSIKMDDGKCINRTRAAGMTGGTIQFPTEVDDHYRCRLNVRTASSFSQFTVTARDYDIAFYGADCAGGEWNAKPSQQYQVNSVCDGFGGIIAVVTKTEGDAFQTQAITDTGGYYTTDTVEGALQEIGAELAGVNTLIGSGVIT